ncbi:GPN-loop GTPase 2 isoform X2 [Parasteatoda tepidariorum]|uniref:GPN-loop GTPase 2 isoform X1 n=1 Tax=Parasteatoda tepidariorum TaxID=114398 RepID=UPI00077FD935|nr:GPN-loop GTPase 2 isoform X1 [Parasteatoda tepidariorum]XP_015904714.1 GPN-loop GTPase 2 isoform X2 [Parasteatoda tepidariorum]
MLYGQLVIGPPGSGKTTYCHAMSEFLKGIGRRVAIVNLDPGNDVLPYEASIDVSHLITVDNVMELSKLGPNGGLIFCMEYLEKKVDWLLEELKKFSDCYFLIDCPGQVELYTHHDSVQNIVSALTKSGFQLCSVHLVDSHYCCDPSKFVAILLTSLATMLKMGTPHINVLSKADLIEKHGKLHFDLSYYTDVLDLQEIVSLLSDDPFLARYKKLNEALMGLVEDYSLVSFYVLSIKLKECMSKVLQGADKANGYLFGINEEDRNIQNMLSCAMSAEFEDAKVADIRERYISMDSHVDGFVSKGR